MAESGEIRVLSWNINGLKERLKTEERKTALLEIFDQYDIVLLQETHIGKMDNGTDNDWKTITEALSYKYDLVNLEEEKKQKKKEEEEEKKKQKKKEEEEEKKQKKKKEEEEKKKQKKKEEEEKKKQKKKEEEEETRSATMYMTYFSSSSKGVAILVNKPHKLLTPFSEGGDYAWVNVEIDGQEYTFVSVYYCLKYPDLICNLMLKIIYSFSTKELNAFKGRLVIGGDFNTTLDPELDTANKQNTDNPAHARRRKRVNEFLSIVKLSDVWRERNPGEREYTYNHQSRLDYIFILEDEVRYVESCEIHNDIDLSDHSPVSLTLKYTDIQPREE